ncbi:MAG TPA: hypothetical protein VEA59_05940 [Patescibacteria group bacterium]|nr:hypothetical protein [Patescibacteria group bacterium]
MAIPDNLPDFALLIAALNPNIIPEDDALDLRAGATSIPGRVTDLRRSGVKVRFVQASQDPEGWYWVGPNGEEIR